MSLDNTLQLIQEIKLRHVAMGAAGLAGAAGLGYAANSGLLGVDAQHHMSNLKGGLYGAKMGYQAGKLDYDTNTPMQDSNTIGRHVNAVSGAISGAKLGYQGTKALNDLDPDGQIMKNLSATSQLASKTANDISSKITNSNFFK